MIDHMDNHAFWSVEVDAQAQQAWVRHVYDLAASTLMIKANSWYLGANVPGKPQVFMPYVGGLDVYRDKADGIARDGYRGFHFTAGPAHATRAD